MDVSRLEDVGCERTEASAWIGYVLEKQALTATELQAARAQVNTAPTKAQIASGNYAKGHVTWQGLDIAIENPKGSTRSGTDKQGKKWSQVMHADYGYFKGTKGKDKDHLDVFLGDHLDSELVFVVNQVDPELGTFDEWKVMVGFTNEAAARAGYLANYEPGWRGLGSIVPITLPKFKKRLRDGYTKAALPEKAGAARETAIAGISSLASDEGEVSQQTQQTVRAVRGARDQSLSKVAAELPGVLRRYGSPASGDDVGAEGEQWGLLRRELCVGNSASAIEKQAEQPVLRVPGATVGAERLGESAGYEEEHITHAADHLGLVNRESGDDTGRTRAEDDGDLTKQAAQKPPKMGGPFRMIDPQAPFSEELQAKGEQIYSLVKAKKRLQDSGRKRGRRKRAADWNARLGQLQARRDPDGLEAGGDLSQLQPDQQLDFVIQHHLQSRAGRHYDIRFGNPELGLFSWASRKDLPLPGSKTLLNQTPLHEHSYGDFQSQNVRRKRKGQIRVTGVGDGKIHFTTEDDNPQQFLLLRPPSFTGRRWLLINRTPREQFDVKTADDWLKEAADNAHVPTVAVDLDGTLAENLPQHDPQQIGPPRKHARKWLKRFRKAGARLIIFTVRGDKQLVQTWLEEHKMPYDYINENPDQPPDSSGKVIADVYYDDRAVNADRPHNEAGPEVLALLKSAASESILTYQDPGSILEFIYWVKDADSA